MRIQSSFEPWWAILTIWGIVNVVNLLQAIGFLSRVRTGDMALNHALGYLMIALTVPALAALVALARARVGWFQWVGAAVYVVFILLMIIVDYAMPVEFRSPARVAILAPYLVLFFGSILLMGLPMFNLNRLLWIITVATTVLLLTSMGTMRHGVG